jgi:chromosome segregation ATPase
VAVDYDDRDLLPAPPVGARYAAGTAPLHTKTYWSRLQKSLVDHLLRTETLDVPVNKALKVVGRIGETPEAFGARVAEAARAAADADAAKLRAKYEPRVKRLRDQILDASGDAQAYAAEVEANSQSSLTSVAGGLIGSLFGGRKRSAQMEREVAAAQRRAQTAGAKQAAAEQKWSALHADLVALEGQIADELAEINARWQAAGAQVETLSVKLKRTNIQVADFVLAWVPRL